MIPLFKMYERIAIFDLIYVVKILVDCNACRWFVEGNIVRKLFKLISIYRYFNARVLIKTIVFPVLIHIWDRASICCANSWAHMDGGKLKMLRSYE